MSESERYRLTLVQITLLMAKLYNSQPKKTEPEVVVEEELPLWPTRSEMQAFFSFIRRKLTKQRSKISGAQNH